MPLGTYENNETQNDGAAEKTIYINVVGRIAPKFQDNTAEMSIFNVTCSGVSAPGALRCLTLLLVNTFQSDAKVKRWILLPEAVAITI